MSTPNLFFAVVVALSALLSIKYCRFGPKDTFLKFQQQSHFPASFRADEAESSLERLSLQHLTKPNTTAADVTAVILNWTRLSNVVRIVSLLCDPMLDGILATIFIWNNNPATVLTQEQLGCQHKLRLFNSPTNAYFGARFEACVAASTPFCFIQDDDYLVLPEILYTLRARISELSVSGIFLQPPNEMLSSTLSRITLNSKIHTSFSWLGYGSMIRRSEAKDFLSLMRLLNVTDDEFKMADNYFSILRNVFTENWFDQNIPLGGGLPFTVGQEGLERNNRHILRAADLLASVLLCEHPPCISLPAQIQDVPYVQSRPPSRPSSSMAPCVGAVCLLETSISMLPNEPKTEVQSTRDILEIQEKNIQSINGKELDLYLNHPPSYAVDGNPETGFCRGSAKKGEYISLDLLDATPKWKQTELVFLVDVVAEALILNSSFRLLGKGDLKQQRIDTRFVCHGLGRESGLKECYVSTSISIAGYYAFQIQFEEDAAGLWCIYEMWMRGR